MAGTQRSHNEVLFNLLLALGERFRGRPCRVYSARYRRLEMRRDYVLVSADRMRVEHHRLQDNGVWTYDDHREPASRLRLASVNCALPLAEIYERVTLPGAGAAP